MKHYLKKLTNLFIVFVFCVVSMVGETSAYFLVQPADNTLRVYEENIPKAKPVDMCSRKKQAFWAIFSLSHKMIYETSRASSTVLTLVADCIEDFRKKDGSMISSAECGKSPVYSVLLEICLTGRKSFRGARRNKNNEDDISYIKKTNMCMQRDFKDISHISGIRRDDVSSKGITLCDRIWGCGTRIRGNMDVNTTMILLVGGFKGV